VRTVLEDTVHLMMSGASYLCPSQLMNTSDRIKLHKMQRNKHSALQCEDISMLHKFDLLSIVLMVRLTSTGEKIKGHTVLVVCQSALCKIRNGKFDKLLKPQEES